MIEFRNVHKTYKSGVDALRGVDFTIEDGEFVFIIGKSGSGKSTLLKCITCEETPTEGEVLIDGFDIASMSRKLVPVLRRELGMIYQDFRLIETKTVAENIAFAGEIIGIPRKQLDQTVQLVLNVVGLKEKAEAYPQELSGGEQQRVAVARAMVGNPKIIVADEPTGNLDPDNSENIMGLLLDINRSGTTVIVCTHDSNLVDRMKMRVLEIEEGLVARDQKDSSYLGEEIKEEVHAPITVSSSEVGFAFGDDPAFEHDAEYSDSYDDDEYTQLNNPVAFGDEELASAPLPVDVATIMDAIEADVKSEAEVAISEISSYTPVEELLTIPSEASVEENDELPVNEISSEEKANNSDSNSQELLFGNSVEQSEAAVEEDDEELESSEAWLNKIDKDLEDSDIDLDISEDD